MKLLLGRRKQEPLPTIRAGEGNNIIVSSQGQNFIFNRCVMNIAEKAQPHYKNLTDLVGHEQADVISFGDRKKPEVQLSKNLVGLFDELPEFEADPVLIKCDIFDFNKYNNSGKLHVQPDEDIPEGVYSFAVEDHERQAELINSMLRTSVRVRCKPVTSIGPAGIERIKKLTIIGVELRAA